MKIKSFFALQLCLITVCLISTSLYASENDTVDIERPFPFSNENLNFVWHFSRVTPTGIDSLSAWNEFNNLRSLDKRIQDEKKRFNILQKACNNANQENVNATVSNEEFYKRLAIVALTQTNFLRFIISKPLDHLVNILRGSKATQPLIEIKSVPLFKNDDAVELTQDILQYATWLQFIKTKKTHHGFNQFAQNTTINIASMCSGNAALHYIKPHLDEAEKNKNSKLHWLVNLHNRTKNIPIIGSLIDVLIGDRDAIAKTSIRLITSGSLHGLSKVITTIIAKNMK